MQSLDFLLSTIREAVGEIEVTYLRSIYFENQKLLNLVKSNKNGVLVLVVGINPNYPEATMISNNIQEIRDILGSSDKLMHVIIDTTLSHFCSEEIQELVSSLSSANKVFHLAESFAKFLLLL